MSERIIFKYEKFTIPTTAPSLLYMAFSAGWQCGVRHTSQPAMLPSHCPSYSNFQIAHRAVSETAPEQSVGSTSRDYKWGLAGDL